MEKLDIIRQNMKSNENNLSKYACLSDSAIRLQTENSKDIRNAFARDVDKIVHTLSYTRYLDKTQVYSDAFSDHISTRMTHVQFVSRASRTIARALRANEDLCEAIALGHDIGHVPYGHEGERILSSILKEKVGMSFAHNIQSVRTFMEIEKNGRGLNLTLQVLDGIMCHNGEMLQDEYYPVKKTSEEFMLQYNECLIDDKKIKNIRPMTLEGCIVRISDIIGYVGKDIDDAVMLGLLDRSAIPENVKNVLGSTNAEIMNSIIVDIINESFEKPYIKMSKKVSDALANLKEFNYKNIYDMAISEDQHKKREKMFRFLYDTYMNALKNDDRSNDIFTLFLEKMSDRYLSKTRDEIKVVDYIAGMTDNFFEMQYDKYKNN